MSQEGRDERVCVLWIHLYFLKKYICIGKPHQVIVVVLLLLAFLVELVRSKGSFNHACNAHNTIVSDGVQLNKRSRDLNVCYLPVVHMNHIKQSKLT